MKPALLVVDVQKEFFKIDPLMTESLNHAVHTINAAIGLFRERGLPILAIQNMNPNENLVPGTQGFELPDELRILPTDPHIHKLYGNSFNKTTLESELRRLEVDTPIISGFAAEYCVLSAYRGAEDRDLKPILLLGAIASSKPEHIQFVESLCDVVSLGALKKLLTSE